ncbi:carnitine 3-dehydrogenase [Jannaschia ovalis]|uniref:Carnitine 3-dehydrogenase n=1 Tax=Jannaschia ovalis TaxID=3038773 RepID=A0ABY8L9K8_9RHOB|nr:carnitine 3-dehydrogenase [Jannaschia sp. GRR-S6-38]WGH77991.1 carnitine 3-dehydrogenase [Jannaschia sp. GRR-S6-38]
MKAAILGGGVIGGGWAARFLLNGWDVAVFDPAPGAAAALSEVLDGARRALPMLYDRALPVEGRLQVAATLEAAVSGADWVQESVPERLALKHEVLGAACRVAKDAAVVASSTSGFKPSDLNAAGARAIVAHPFNPVYLLPLVELVGPDTARAAEILRELGMFPLEIGAEIDAHIADRLLEAVWREALWLVRDGIATTAQIDEAIRMGFGLRWAQMGLFETYRIAGGPAGIAHFLRQFGPALKWPWTRLMDVPELDAALVDRIATQSDAQSGHLSLRELERRRDDALVTILRGLRRRGQGAGEVVAAHEARLPAPEGGLSVRRRVPVTWTDWNGHMNEGRYGQVFSDAADAVMARCGAMPGDGDGWSFFTVETTIRYLAETHAGDPIEVATEVVEAAGKKLRLRHRMTREGSPLAECDQLLLHVELDTRRSAPMPEAMAARLRDFG